jgi:hypothetical protein
MISNISLPIFTHVVLLSESSHLFQTNNVVVNDYLVFTTAVSPFASQHN